MNVYARIGLETHDEHTYTGDLTVSIHSTLKKNNLEWQNDWGVGLFLIEVI